jgi:hypothetical protein
VNRTSLRSRTAANAVWDMPKKNHHPEKGSDLEDVEVAVKEILSQIQSKLSDHVFLTQACKWLTWQFHRSPEAFERMDATPILATLMQAMRVHPRVPNLLLSILAIILLLVDGTREGGGPNRDFFLREGGLEMVTAAMVENDDMLVHLNACSLINHLYGNLLAVQLRTSSSVLKAVLASMDKHTHDFTANSSAEIFARCEPLGTMQQLDGVGTEEKAHEYHVANCMHILHFYAICQKASNRNRAGCQDDDVRLRMGQAVADESIKAIARTMRAHAKVAIQAAGEIVTLPSVPFTVPHCSKESPS